MAKEVPWRKVKSWACLGCGTCCTRFDVALRPYEYAKIFKLMPEAVVVDVKPYLRRIKGRCVFLNEYGLCTLQELGLKPFSCKVWPFLVYDRPKYGNREEAEFYYVGEKYYVYLNKYAVTCPGINAGKPEELPNIISEIIEIYKDPHREQRYSTSRRIKLLVPISSRPEARPF